MKLALGTVQFGLPYGIANRQGQVSLDEAGRMLACARSHGIDTLDTAIAYGDSERVLGMLGIGGWKVVSKLPAVPDDCRDVRIWVDEQLSGSLNRLGVQALDALLLHQSAQLLDRRWGERLYAALCEQKLAGRIHKIGVSVYQPSELDALATRFPAFDLVQAPLNVFDRSLANSGWLQRLYAAGTEVHVRSVFLQGLLLLPADERPPAFNRWSMLWREWDRWLCDSDVSALTACLQYPASLSSVSRIVVGADSLAHLQQILQAAETGGGAIPPDTLQSWDPDLVNPSLWGRLA